MIGARFGILTVMAIEPTRGDGPVYVCRCDCGSEYRSEGYRVRKGSVKSCGRCGFKGQRGLYKKHGHHNTPTYGSWKGMKARCDNPNDPYFHKYGGRGIGYCMRWSAFDAFLADMGERPDGMTLDRKDNDKDYEPGNCRWATTTQQNRNRQDTLRITIGKETLSLADWCERYSAKYGLALGRIQRRGWDPLEALTTPSFGQGGAHLRKQATQVQR